ncbi:PHO85 cyclin-5 [Tieghemiomyces parasiticus]|uniref:PHO85 cyclin-5 n=1 Tax=Tieghemiomyces parasiticus TaxID=78921 RepID=A0A9W8DZ15_9FUNG|nr:PHO85 cyclin-5 [Tieghemiomyces parasiticus]
MCRAHQVYQSHNQAVAVPSTRPAPTTVSTGKPAARVAAVPPHRPTLSTPPASPDASLPASPVSTAPTTRKRPADPAPPTPRATPQLSAVSSPLDLAAAAARILAPPTGPTPSPLLSATASFNGKPLVTPVTSEAICASKKDPTRCGRRMYLAALMAASKFFLDKTYSNKAWSKISTLKVSEVNHLEIAFLHLVNFDLYVDPALFDNWSRTFNDYLRLLLTRRV